MANTLQSSANPLISERRMHWRQKVFSSHIELGENNRGDILNISPSGLALQVDEELNDDELPKMRFQLSETPAWIETKGRIAWRNDSKRVAGVEFIDLSPETRKQILLSIFLSDESECSKTNAPLERAEQGSGAMATSEPTNAFPFPESTLVELVTEDRKQQSIFPSVQSSVETQDAGAGLENAGVANVPRGSGKAGRLAGLSLAALLLLLAFFSLRHHSQRAETSQRGRETTTEPNLPELFSKISATPASIPGPTSLPPVRTSNPGPSLDHHAFVLQVGAMVDEENANALAESLRKMSFPAFVLQSPTNRFHRVLVGPYNGADAALNAKNELEKHSFKAIRTEWKPQAR